MPARTRSYHDCKRFFRSSSICASFFAMIWCINMLVSAVTSLSYVSKYFEEWIEAEALIIGRNVTVHYQNSSQSRRRLITSNITDSTMEDFWGNDTDTFGVMNVTNDGDDALGNLDSWNDLGNATDPESNVNNNTDMDGWDSNEDLNDTNSATSAPTPLPPVVEPGEGGRLVYCAEVQFRINGDVTITAVSDTYCSYNPEDIVVGRAFVILYNPEMHTEIIEESLYVHAQNTLRLTVGVTIMFTLGYLFCSIYLWRSQPVIGGSIFPHTGHDLDFQDVNANEITQTPEEREAIMQNMFYFQTVLEDLSNTDAATIRRLCLEEEDEYSICCDEACCCNGKSSKEDTGKKIQLQDDIEAQHEKDDPLQQADNEEENDLVLDLTNKESRDENSTLNTEADSDTDAGSNNQGSAATETNDDKQPQQESQDQESTWSLAGASNLISSWTNAALAPSAPECCICLETYQPGDKICTSKKDGCDHVFHQECIEAWLHRHNACPLCRVDLMNSDQ